MTDTQLSPKLHDELVKAQRNEITEYRIYTRLARVTKDWKNAEVLEKIGQDDGRHARFWSEYTKVEPKPYRIKVVLYYWIARVLGLVFGVKLMERGDLHRNRLHLHRLRAAANPFYALPITLLAAMIIIAGFNYYISVAQDLPFGKRFWEMTILSFGVAGFSFVVGIVIRSVFGIDT